MTHARRPERSPMPGAYPQPRRRGCGCTTILAATAAVFALIAGIIWLIGTTTEPEPHTRLEPVPTEMPPKAAEEPPLIDVHGPGRTSDLLFDWSQPIGNATNMNGQAVRAYANAALIAKDAWPACNLEWNTLAGIGWVETRHGTYGGRFDQSRLNEHGVATPPIVGPALNGTGNFAKIVDTDGGALDGDEEYDRAVGPMQFIPESWARYGRDANGDGVADPQQIDDAALSAANLLCAGGRDLATEEGWREAIFAYNRSNDYVVRVRDAAANYAANQPAHR